MAVSETLAIFLYYESGSWFETLATALYIAYPSLPYVIPYRSSDKFCPNTNDYWQYCVHCVFN